ncbi:MAG: hypothetical protein A2275_13015 [Bacteroidetes bacterium RIFOXYA12_FULL_35_11]|nr:MAG: hypothetical protein A2X01_07325 [Bacteroidetes bacterium GWF2_35_48]OFY76874.1 MAG: hypothetical protein A2275_13015 [Bacteroidetes bacterium RIFOXYA12_FULL_35_11]OFZ02472.1 MAG: hypothetical protein A2491_06915 [Bacteroidetes bacterium RIFOXYC12_FULL_35_7]
MRILQITNKVPFPPVEGGSIAINMITQGLLKAGHSVKILAMNTPKNNIDIHSLPESYRKSTNVEAVFVDNRVKIIDAFLNLFFSRKSYHVVRFINDCFESALEKILQREMFDIVLLEMLYVTPYIPVIRKNSDAKIILRTHNIEHLIWERLAYNSGFLKKKYLQIISKRLKKYEIEQFSKVDGIAAITALDATFIRKYERNIPLTDIPVAAEPVDDSDDSISPEYPGLFHLGSMNWMPNFEGIKWFIYNVWPLIHLKFPGVKLYLAGRAMPDRITNLNNEHIIVIGEVPDAGKFMKSKSVMIVPLLSGGGMRVKIIEGMQYGKTIISTKIGAEGIDCEHEKNILIADTPDQFVDCIGKVIQNENYGKQLGQNAKQLIHEKYDNTTVTKRLLAFFEMLLNASSA